MEDPSKGAGAVRFSFPVAFALTVDRGMEQTLAYYRVRDHLRKIGLGRSGLSVLRGAKLVIDLMKLDADEQALLALEIPEADYRTLQRLWDSVVKSSVEPGRV